MTRVDTWHEVDLRTDRPPAEGEPPVGWLHSGIDRLPDGTLLLDDPTARQLLVIDPRVGVLGVVPSRSAEAHGIAVDATDAGSGSPLVWVADHVLDMQEVETGRFEPRHVAAPVRGGVRALSANGDLVAQLDLPPALGQAAYRPTDIALDHRSGDLWVADGYGQGRVHRYGPDRRHVGWIDGTDGAGRFAIPHSIHIDVRANSSRILVADRENGRVSVHDPRGVFLGTIGQGILRRPTGMATCGEDLVVADLTGRLTVFDGGDRFLRHLGEASADPLTRPGWPNAVDQDGGTVTPRLRAGELNSPHDIAAMDDRTVAVCEWVVGGRLTIIGW